MPAGLTNHSPMVGKYTQIYICWQAPATETYCVPCTDCFCCKKTVSKVAPAPLVSSTMYSDWIFIMSKPLAHYCKQHPSPNVLHVTLAAAGNNQDLSACNLQLTPQHYTDSVTSCVFIFWCERRRSTCSVAFVCFLSRKQNRPTPLLAYICYVATLLTTPQLTNSD